MSKNIYRKTESFNFINILILIKPYKSSVFFVNMNSDLDIIINIIENKMYLQGYDIEQFNNLNFEYLEAEDDSGDAYVMDFNLEEISKLIK